MNDLLLGNGLLETLKVRGKRALFLEEHIARLVRSARFMRIPEDVVNEAIAQIERLESEQDGLWRVLLSVDGVQPPQWREAPDLSVQRLKTCLGTYDPSSRVREHKTNSYANNFYARRIARDHGFDDALMVSDSLLVGEAPFANIFFVDRSGSVFTPPANGLLPGTRRGLLMAEGALEREIRVGDFEEFEHVFLTSAAGMKVVSSIDETRFNTELPNHILDQISLW